MAKFELLVSGFSDQLHRYEVDPAKDALTFQSKQSMDGNHSWLEYHKATGDLYATHELKQHEEFGTTGAVSRWKLQQDGQTFKRMEV